MLVSDYGKVIMGCVGVFFVLNLCIFGLFLLCYCVNCYFYIVVLNGIKIDFSFFVVFFCLIV